MAGNTWHGSLNVPRQCEKAQACPIRFDLHTDEFATDGLGGLVNEAPGKQPWYRFLSSPTQPKPYLASLHAIGKLTANRVVIHNLLANPVSAEVELDRAAFKLSDLRGDLLGGRHSGEWQVDFTVNPPTFHGNGALQRVALGQIAEAMHDEWITGTASVEYRADTSGWTKAELLSHADAGFQVDARDGSLSHLISRERAVRCGSTGSWDGCCCAPGSSKSIRANFRLRAASIKPVAQPLWDEFWISNWRAMALAASVSRAP